MSTQHTALPWRWLGMTGKPCLIQADGNWRTKLTRATLTLGDFVLPEDAEFACRAVNNHYPLLEALEAIHKRATPRSQDFLHPTKEFADDVARLASDAIERAEESAA